MTKSAFYGKYHLAWHDVTEGLKSWRTSLLMAWHEIKLRYRRSTLGPFWITLTMAVTIYTMGLLYGRLFKMDLVSYFPFLATGILGWNLISSILNDATMTFVNAEPFIKQMKQPYSGFVLQSVTRNFIVFFHHLLVLVPLILLSYFKLNINTLFIVISLLILFVNAVSYSTLLAFFGTRFRDVPILVASFIQIVFFLTPIIWSPSNLPIGYHYIIDLNPFAQFMELFRNPLLGKLPSQYALFTCLGLTIVGILSAFIVFSHYRARVSYWL